MGNVEREAEWWKVMGFVGREGRNVGREERNWKGKKEIMEEGKEECEKGRGNVGRELTYLFTCGVVYSGPAWVH